MLKPGDKCKAPPPQSTAVGERVEATYVGAAPDLLIGPEQLPYSEPARIRVAWVEHDGQVYTVDAEQIDPA